jgi:hypothetical protein
MVSVERARRVFFQPRLVALSGNFPHRRASQVLAIVMAIVTAPSFISAAATPRLERQGSTLRLVVNDEPMRHVRLAPGRFQIQQVRFYRYR